MNTNFDVMVIEGNERDGTLWPFTKEETKGVKI
jgi:general stress protein 26